MFALFLLVDFWCGFYVLVLILGVCSVIGVLCTWGAFEVWGVGDLDCFGMLLLWLCFHLLLTSLRHLLKCFRL